MAIAMWTGEVLVYFLRFDQPDKWTEVTPSVLKGSVVLV